MNSDPLATITEITKEQKLVDKILCGVKDASYRLLEIEVYNKTPGVTVPICINTRYVTHIEEAGAHAYIYLSDGSKLHTVASYADTIKSLTETPTTTNAKAYIK